VAANDTDPHGFPLTVTDVNGTAIDATHPVSLADGSGVVTLNPNGSLTFTPTASYAGTPTFTYVVDDGHGSTAMGTVTGAVYAPPVATDDTFTSVADTIATINARANDTDPNGFPLVITSVNGTPLVSSGATIPVTGGSVGLDASGNLTFVPNVGFTGNTSFTYTVSDGHGGTATATVNGAVFAPPAATTDGFVSVAGQPVTIDVLANDTDPNGLTPTITQVNGHAITVGGPAVSTAHGSITLTAAGQLIYTPVSGAAGPESFTYTISDGHGSSTATVTGINEVAPRVDLTSSGAVYDYASAWWHSNVNSAPNHVSIYTASGANEAAGPGLTFQITGTSGIISNDTATSLSQAIATGAYMQYSFTTTGTVDPNVFISGFALNNPGATGTVAFQLAQHADFTDAVTLKDGVALNTSSYGMFDTHTFIQPNTTYFARVYIYNAPGVQRYDDFGILLSKAAPNYVTTFTEGLAAVAIAAPAASVTDGDSANMSSATIKLTNPMTADQLSAGNLPSGITASAYDPTTHTLTLTGTANLAAYQAAIKAITFSNSDSNPSTTDRIIDVTVTDETGLISNTAVATVHVIAVDNAPVEVLPANPSISAGTPIILTGLSVTDVDANGGTETVTLSVGHGTLTLGATSGLTFVVGTGTGEATTTFTGTLADINAAIAAVTYKSTIGFGGVDTLTFVTNDTGNTGIGGPLTTTQTLAITVWGPPVAVDDHFLTASSTPIIITPLSNDTDPNAFSLTVTQINGQAIDATHPVTLADGSGRVALNPDGTLTFTPSTGYSGQPSFHYTVADQHGGTATAQVTGTVWAPPVAQTDTFAIAAGTPVVTMVLANDTDVNGFPLTITKINGSPIAAGSPPVAVAGGTITLDVLGRLTYTPTPGSSGTPSFNYTVDDGHGGSATAIVNGTVWAPPVATPDTIETVAGKSVVIRPLVNDTDPNGFRLTVTQINELPITAGGPYVAVTGGTVGLDAAGNLTFMPSHGYAGTPSFTYTVDDGHGGTSRVTVSVTVNPQTLPQKTPLAPVTTDIKTLQNTAYSSQSGIVGATVHGISPRESGFWSTTNAGDVLNAGAPWRQTTFTGSSLRIDVDPLASGADIGAGFLVQSIVSDGVLSLSLEENRTNADGRHIVDYRVLQADGRALPQWMERPSIDLVQGKYSADTETIDLKITAVYSDGTVVTDVVRVNTLNGTIQSLPRKHSGLGQQLFAKQFAGATTLGHTQRAVLAEMLGWHR
jgi:hypothetical protein